MSKKVTVYVDEKLLQKVKVAAVTDGKTLSGFVSESLEEYLARRAKKKKSRV